MACGHVKKGNCKSCRIKALPKKQNGGWLDSYEDGGEFSEPYVAKDRADFDFRNQMYNDSLNLHKGSNEQLDYIRDKGIVGNRIPFSDDNYSEGIASAYNSPTFKAYGVGDFNIDNYPKDHVGGDWYHRDIKPTETYQGKVNDTQSGVNFLYKKPTQKVLPPREEGFNEELDGIPVKRVYTNDTDYILVDELGNELSGGHDTKQPEQKANQWRITKNDYGLRTDDIYDENGQHIDLPNKEFTDRAEFKKALNYYNNWQGNADGPIRKPVLVEPKRDPVPSKMESKKARLDTIEPSMPTTGSVLPFINDVYGGKMSDEYVRLSNLTKQGLPAGDNYAIGNFPNKAAKGMSQEEYAQYFLNKGKEKKDDKLAQKKNGGWLDEL